MSEVADDVLDAWAFNVRLECLGSERDKADVAIGGAILNLHDLDALLHEMGEMRGIYEPGGDPLKETTDE